MADVLQLPFVQRGLLEVVVLAAGAGVIGTWIVLRGLAFYAHAVGTAAFPGLVLAEGLGFGALLGAAATGVVVAGGVAWLARRPGGRERYDALTALVLVGALAAGVILASDVFHSGSSVETLLFGSLLLVDRGDIALAAAASLAVVVLAAVLGRRWLVAGFDPATAPALGVRSAWPDAMLLGLVALVVVAALSTIGALLTSAVLVVPAATTRLVCDRLGRWQAATVALVVAEGVTGLWLSVELNAPPGPAIAVLSGVVFAVVAIVRSAPARALAAGAAAVLLAVVGAGCGTVASGDASGRLPVVASTTQLGDLARAVGGDAVAVTQILRPNTDPHEYEPRPDDVRRTAGARVVLTSGDELDRWMAEVVRDSGTRATVVDVGSRLRIVLPGEASGPEASRVDPHWWHDPRNAAQAVRVIRDALTRARPADRATFARNAAAYLRRLRALDAGIARCLSGVPRAQRRLVTDHDALGYFARRYGIVIVGAVIPSQTTQAQPSAGDVSRLVRTIRREHVRAIFPEASLNASLARTIAAETGATSRYSLYGDTLGPAGSRGATYLGMEAANADAIVRGLTGGARGCGVRP